MTHPFTTTFLALTLVGAGTLSACVDPDEGDGDFCTADLRFHQIDLVRDFSSASTPAELDVDACVGDTCYRAKPATGGALSFDAPSPYGDSPSEGTLTAVGPGAYRVQVRFSVTEGVTSPLTVRVSTPQGQLVLDESASVQWGNEPCHPLPRSTTL